MSRRVKLTICICAKSAFGTVITVRSRPRSRVERRPISSTVPILSPKLQNSPTRTGLSANSTKPPTMFSSVGRIASATARPPTPRPAMIGVMLRPSSPGGVEDDDQGADDAEDAKAQPDQRRVQPLGARGERTDHEVADAGDHRRRARRAGRSARGQDDRRSTPGCSRSRIAPSSQMLQGRRPADRREHRQRPTDRPAGFALCGSACPTSPGPPQQPGHGTDGQQQRADVATHFQSG